MAYWIEVDGLHVDQNGANAGYRPPVYLDVNAQGVGECKNFALTYRTSAQRPKSTTNFSITWTLQRSTSGYGPGTAPSTVVNGGWTDVQTFTRSVSIVRTVGSNNDDDTNFNSCSSQGRVASGERD